jgi:predicted nucleotidyltransferase
MSNTRKSFDPTQDKNISNILDTIGKLCSHDSNIKKAILHGSWAKGTAMARSDIDIALEGDGIDMDNITDAIEQIDTLYTIDLVSLSQCKNELLKEEVKKYGITIYNQI